MPSQSFKLLGMLTYIIEEQNIVSFMFVLQTPSASKMQIRYSYFAERPVHELYLFIDYALSKGECCELA